MSDNANKMGTSIESIKNAYMGFAKQNFTMLDNLKLGYGGTKEEMERLLRDAEEFEGLELGQLSTDNFADIINAIDIIQDKLGITGTTAEEAMKTIAGSASATKAAWQNIITAIGSGEGLDTAMDGLVTAMFGDENGGGLLNNIIPRIQEVMKGIGNFLEKAAPLFAEKIPAIVDAVLPELLSGGVTLLKALGKTFGGLVPTIVKMLMKLIPEVAKLGVDLIKALATGIVDNLGTLVEAALEIVQELATALVESLPELVPAVVEMLLKIAETLTDPTMLSQLVDAAIAIAIALADGLIQALPILIEMAPTIISNLVTAIVENVPKLMTAAWEIIKMLVNGIVEKLPEIGTAAGQIVAKIGEGLAELWGKMLEVGTNIIGGIVQGIQNKWEWLKEQVSQFFTNFVNAIKDFFGIHSPSTLFADIGDNIIAGLINGIKDKWNDLKEWAGKIAGSIKDKFYEKINAAKEWGSDLVKNFTDGIKSKWESLKSTVSNMAQTVKNFLGFSEPKEGPLSNFHTYAPDMMELFAKGIKDNTDVVTDQIKKSFDFSDQIVPVGANFNGSDVVGTAQVGSRTVQYVININQPVDSPDEMVRAIRTESQYGLILGGDLIEQGN